MRTEQGSIHDSRAIAAIYAEAFPHSTRFFFRKKKPERLSGLLELTFNLVFLWGRTSNRGQKRPGGAAFGLLPLFNRADTEPGLRSGDCHRL